MIMARDFILPNRYRHPFFSARYSSHTSSKKKYYFSLGKFDLARFWQSKLAIGALKYVESIYLIS